MPVVVPAAQCTFPIEELKMQSASTSTRSEREGALKAIVGGIEESMGCFVIY